MRSYIIMLGPPGAGKGTQAKRLAKQLNVSHISSGDLFRAMKTMDTPLAKRVQDIMARGHLVDDQTTIEVVAERLSREDVRGRGAILDGFPRNADQAEWLKKYLANRGDEITVALLINVPREVVVARILRRAEEEGREDDKRPEVAEHRYEIYLNETKPLEEYYRRAGLLRTINGDQTMDRVTEALLSAIPQEHAGAD
jgi:adenylate kinase